MAGLFGLALGFAMPVVAAPIPVEAETLLDSGQPVSLIVEYDDTAIETQVAGIRQQRQSQSDDEQTLAFKRNEYQKLKSQWDQQVAGGLIETSQDFGQLPMSLKRFRNRADLEAFAALPGIRAVYPDKLLQLSLAQSLPLIGQPAVSAAGLQGSGTTVAVIDNGINYSLPAFGSCTAPGQPAACKVVASQNFSTGTSDNSHGTNVSGTVLGVAPDTRIAMLNPFSSTGALTSDVISAINWAISNRSLYNIVAINMSLGDGTRNTSACNANNPFKTPVNNARNAGMQVVAASGNEGYTNGISSPACTPGVISVGAVYDSSMGSLNWGICSDTTATDKVTCFSNSASFLTMLAPGAIINAAGISMSGTSQASPHVAGAVAVLQARFPTETLAQIQTRMTSTGTNITDSRNSITKPRLNLLAAARPGNDLFANRVTLSGRTGSVVGNSLLATQESGEPVHAGVGGGQSVWWQWTAPASGQVTLDTSGSSFDTVLAVYQGSAVGTLTSVASDNNGATGGASRVYFQAVAGQTYVMAVDGVAGASGSVNLGWSLNTTASANLAASLSGPGSVDAGVTYDYLVQVSNAGPQWATNVRVVIALPAQAALASLPAGCSLAGAQLTCLLGDLASGATGSLTVSLIWQGLTSSSALTLSVNSDVPDAVVTNNAASVAVSPAPPPAPSTSDSDTPLPAWGFLLLAGLLNWVVARTRRATA